MSFDRLHFGCFIWTLGDTRCPQTVRPQIIQSFQSSANSSKHPPRSRRTSEYAHSSNKLLIKRKIVEFNVDLGERSQTTSQIF